MRIWCTVSLVGKYMAASFLLGIIVGLLIIT
jgi:hypothetical protein